MKITIFRKQKNGSESIACQEFNDFINSIRQDVKGMPITKFRERAAFLSDKLGEAQKGHIPTLTPVSEYLRKKSGEHAMRLYNGVSMLKVEGLNNILEVERVKKQAAQFPQVLCAIMGADGLSVSIWTLAQRPDGTLPKGEKEAKWFSAQAYATSVRCLQPSLEFKITLEEPSLDKRMLFTIDENPYVNPNATPFLIEQPTEESLQRLVETGDPQNRFERIKPSANAYITFTHLFNAAVSRVLGDMPAGARSCPPQQMITLIAQKCVECGLPEEEVATRLAWRYSSEGEEEVRGTVNTIYEEYQGKGRRSPMSKHQLVAFRLREFLRRRYDIRYNEVLAMTEYRPRMSLQFLYKELDRRELNSIHHEACLEGIDPTFGEVDNLVHSSHTPLYNPITEYLNELPTWDGKDRITLLARMVPNNNPSWQRLFYRWFLSMVAHWLNCDTTHANQTAPILIGAQGYRKSTFCRLMLPPELQMFFTDSIDFRSNVEAERCLSRFLLVNIDEFDQLNEKQFAFVKHLFQKPVTNLRRMYSETIGTQRRYASFIGTSNHSEILRDPTGNRRYICVEVTAPIRTEEPIEYAQLYAQAKYLILHGERYYLNDEDEALIRQMNEDFEVETPLEQLFLASFCKPEHNDGKWLSTTEIMEILRSRPTFNRRKDLNPAKLGYVLTKLQIKKERKAKGFVYLVKRVED